MRIMERVPAAPFREWLERRITKIGMDLDQQEGVRVVAGELLPDVTIESAVRMLYRYRNSLDGQDVPTDEHPLEAVERMLDNVGVRVWEVYPELELDDVGRDGYCRSCRLEVTTIGGGCPWCDGPVDDHRPKRSASRKGQSRRVSESELRAMNVEHLAGTSISDIGRREWRRLGYAHAHSCSDAIARGFRELGLERRDRLEASRAASIKHGATTNRAVAPGSPDHDRYLKHMRGHQRRMRERRWREAGLVPCPQPLASGRQCASWVKPGEKQCGRHAARLALVARPEPFVIDEDVMAEIGRRLEVGEPIMRVAGDVLARTPYASVGSLMNRIRRARRLGELTRAA